MHTADFNSVYLKKWPVATVRTSQMAWPHFGLSCPKVKSTVYRRLYVAYVKFSIQISHQSLCMRQFRGVIFCVKQPAILCTRLVINCSFHGCHACCGLEVAVVEQNSLVPRPSSRTVDPLPEENKRAEGLV